MGTYNIGLGRKGEEMAVRYLENHGYTILEKNFKARYAELDIVATHEDTLVFIEVKTRAGVSFGLPEEAVTPRKLRELMYGARYYKMLHPELPESLRIDVVAILLDSAENIKSLKHIQNVS